jgi:enamine deaminase RidA (YjgF/YER057c/UK114 family)
MSVESRLTELGIELTEAAAPLAIYRPAVRTGQHVYVSGQIASKGGAVMHPGHLGGDVTVEQGPEAARVACVNALAATRGLLGSLEGLRVVRLVGYVACTPDFDQQPAVVNGASELLQDVFGVEHGIGARLALGVAALPARSPVEIEVLFEVAGQ